MAVFSGKPVLIDRPAAAVAEKFSDLSSLQQVFENLPQDQKDKIGDIDLTADSIVIRTPQVGEIKFVITERTPQRIVFRAQGAPVPLSLIVRLREMTPSTTELATDMDVEIPAFLKPMIGGTMQKAVDQFGKLMQQLA